MTERLTDEQVDEVIRAWLPSEHSWRGPAHALCLAREVQTYRALIPEVIAQLEAAQERAYQGCTVEANEAADMIAAIIARLREAGGQ